MSDRRKRVTVLAEPAAVVLVLTLFLVSAAVGLWGLHKTMTQPGSDPVALWGIRVVCMCLVLYLPVIVLIEPQRYCVWLSFTPEGIEYRAIARRRQLIPYSNFPYLYHGTCLRMAYAADYLIFSDHRLNLHDPSELCDAPPSSSLIKLPFSEELYEKLMSVLPNPQRTQLAAAIRPEADWSGAGAPCAPSHEHNARR